MPAVVMIHGLFGWGEERPLYGLAPSYFPLHQLRKLWIHGPVVAVDVGIASSDHDRACEAFAQLLGMRVDYGDEHAQQCEHERFGNIYEEGLLDCWDASHPVHLVGHSFGGNTAVALYNMIAEDHWGIGTGPDWVLSVTCICSPLRGCSLPFVLGLEDSDLPGGREIVKHGSFTHCLVAIFQFLWKLSLYSPTVLRPLYNVRMDQWREHSNWRNVVSADNRFWSSMDNMMNEITPRNRRRVLRARFGNLSKTCLVAVVSGPLEPLAPAAVARACAPVLAVATLGNCAGLYTLWRNRHRLYETFWKLLSRPWARRMGVLLWLWMVSSNCLAAFALISPRFARRRLLLGAQLETVLEPLRPFLHQRIFRPLFRLGSHLVRKAHRSAPASNALVGSEGGCGAGCDNDGVIDLMSQRGLDAPTLGTLTRLTPDTARALSGQSMPAVREAALARAFSATGYDEHPRASETAQQLEKGKWHVINVQGSDHSLGTWLDPEYTPAMYATVFSLLELSTRERHLAQFDTPKLAGSPKESPSMAMDACRGVVRTEKPRLCNCKC